MLGTTLERIDPDSLVIKRLLLSAERSIVDAKYEKNSNETRFDVAYKAIIQLSNAALQANGYRTLTSKPGHHMTMIQVLSQTIGVDKQTVIVLDALRKQRNIADYSVDLIPVSAVEECVHYAESLLSDVNNWLKESKPDLTSL